MVQKIGALIGSRPKKENAHKMDHKMDYFGSHVARNWVTCNQELGHMPPKFGSQGAGNWITRFRDIGDEIGRTKKSHAQIAAPQSAVHYYLDNVRKGPHSVTCSRFQFCYREGSESFVLLRFVTPGSF